jgi:hypothetical protein
MVWLTTIHGVGLSAMGMESHAPMVHRLPKSRGLIRVNRLAGCLDAHRGQVHLL